MFSFVTRSLTNVMLVEPTAQGSSRGLEVHERDTLRIDGDVPQENRQRAPCHGTKPTNTNALTKRLHPLLRPTSAEPHIATSSFLTSTFELRPLCSYRSRRAGGRSSGVPSTKPPFDWK